MLSANCLYVHTRLLGAPLAAIKKHGRWKSTKMVIEYIEAGRQFKDSAVNVLFDKQSGITYNTIMDRVIIDTNVVISALRSSSGASNLLMTMVGTEKFIPCISVTLILEYEDVIGRHFPKMPKKKKDALLDYLCAVSQHCKVNYLWRPYLNDPGDDMLLELAVSANSKYIITYNQKDFVGVDKFNLQTLTPKEYLMKLGELS